MINFLFRKKLSLLIYVNYETFSSFRTFSRLGNIRGKQSKFVYDLWSNKTVAIFTSQMLKRLKSKERVKGNLRTALMCREIFILTREIFYRSTRLALLFGLWNCWFEQNKNVLSISNPRYWHLHFPFHSFRFFRFQTTEIYCDWRRNPSQT